MKKLLMVLAVVGCARGYTQAAIADTGFQVGAFVDPMVALLANIVAAVVGAIVAWIIIKNALRWLLFVDGFRVVNEDPRLGRGGLVWAPGGFGEALNSYGKGLAGAADLVLVLVGLRSCVSVKH